MKRFSLLLGLLLLLSAGFAQTRADKKFIRMAIGKDSIIYTSKISLYWINEIKRFLSNDTLCDWKQAMRHNKRDMPDSLILILTAAEHTFINRQLDKMTSLRWKENVVKHSMILDTAAARKYSNEHYHAPYPNPKGYGRTVYTFTKPIFIRNNTVCFFYLGEGYGGNLMIYVKENKNWKLKYVPYRWIS